MNIIEFEPGYSHQVLKLVAGVLESLNLSAIENTSTFEPGTAYDDSDLDHISEIYSKRSRFWLAVVGGCVVGTVAIKAVDDTTALLRRMFVAPTYHGTGVGETLLKTALAFAVAQGFRTINLDTHVGMTRAHAFYEKHGFVKIAEDARRRYYELDLTTIDIG